MCVVTNPSAAEASLFESFDSLFQRCLGEWTEKWDEPELDSRVKVEFSTRLTRSLGRAYPKRNLIRLSTALANQPTGELLKMVLCHEFAHLVVFKRHGTHAKPHGQEWRKLIHLAGLNPSTTHKAELSQSRIVNGGARVLFVHKCLACGAKRVAKKPMLIWRCVGCTEGGLDGTLQITTRPESEGARE